MIREIAKNNGHNDWNQILDGIGEEHVAVRHPIVSDALYWKKKEVSIPLDTCKLAQTMPPKVDVQVNVDCVHSKLDLLVLCINVVCPRAVLLPVFSSCFQSGLYYVSTFSAFDLHLSKI